MYKIEESEVIGLSLRNTIEGCGAFKKMALNLLEKNGALNIKDDEWYSLKSTLSIFEEMTRKAGPGLMVQIGKNIPKHAKIPPEIKTFEQALPLLDIIYQMSHRYGEIGSYIVVKESEKTFKVTCDVPYPAKLNFGLIRGFAEKFDTFVDIEELDLSGGGEFLITL